ncbi:MAG TPA: von Willebrand factor type A domain-containing protein [Azonexus sp.]|nr:von Willebrand factor type A domain-containing protein [Azonexus sp.]HZW25738.1 von Willebrand factor type A domain-containing protein [Gallionella sp.]
MPFISARKIAVCALLSAMLLPGCGTPPKEKLLAPPMPSPAQIPMSSQMVKPGMAFARGHQERGRVEHNPNSDADFNTEAYDRIVDNPFLDVIQNPLSTFSIDVDTASYANVRRFITGGKLPPPDAVRIEELVNYFTYDYPQPKGDAPFSFTTELSDAPWHPGHRLLLVGLQGVRIPTDKLPPANLVFLIDVSGSMAAENKLPLLIQSFKLLVGQLRPQDKVAIVVYAGSAGLVLPATGGDRKSEILAKLDSLQAGGSTAGGEGIQLAYRVARENFIKNGNNRVILATDGDFNVGASSDAEMERLIEEKRRDGIFLSVLGYGMGNYKDSKMVELADKGNGNYAYIDSLLEAKKVLITQFGGTMMTIAKDVKLQVEFNPAKVKSYRLIGYEKRMLRAEDFADDKKDAGELGSGHTVTALYEIVPADGATGTRQNLTYQTTQVKADAGRRPELATIRFRYKKPDEDKSRELLNTIPATHIGIEQSSENLRFAASVAEWGMLLRNSEYKGNANNAQILELARKSKGADSTGYRAEFIRLVELAELHGSK